MEPLVTAEQMREYDRSAIDGLLLPGILLMENAGKAFVDALAQRQNLSGCAVAVLCGKGNNGGDGFVIARHLANRGAHVEVLLLAPPREIKGDAALNLLVLKKLAVRHASGIRLVRASSPRAFTDRRVPRIVVDSIFGTGFAGEVRGVYAKAVDWINRSSAYVAAVDIPSGVNGTTGIAARTSVHAALTVTMGCAKLGHYIGAGRDQSGEVVVVDIGIPRFLYKTRTSRVEAADVARLLPKRPLAAHKYSVGKVFILGGSGGFTGAPAMAATSALRSGAGAVILGVPSSLQPVLVKKLTEVILLGLPETDSRTVAQDASEAIQQKCRWADVVAIGPGMGRCEETDRLLLWLIERIEKPLVIDADALTALGGKTHLLRKRKFATILTPHAGELARLIGLPSTTIELKRVEAARSSAERFRSIVILKGSPTVTALPGGVEYLNSSGNPGMATIGSGDVLTGLVAGLLAQGVAPEGAAWAGAFIHGRAGDHARDRLGERSVMAMDILEGIPKTLRELEEGGKR